MAQKKFQNLYLKDAFLFAAALSDAEFCRALLELILGEPVDRVSVHAEHTLFFHSDYRSIRLDVYAEDSENRCFNVEMQGENKGNLPKRSRFHQAQMDVASLKPGQDFGELPPCYIIFICTFDPFGQGLYRYTFENRCQETTLPLGDEVKKIFLNTKGSNDKDVPDTLRHFLHYVENSTTEYAESTTDGTIKMFHDKITALKKSREWERRYMTFGELLDDARNEGRESGLTEGKNCMAALIRKMSEAGETDQLPLLSDPAFLQKMCEKYQL